jgi:DNA-binding MarR family transcriptional regulator
MNSTFDANRLGVLWATLDLHMAAAVQNFSLSAAAILLTLRYRSPLIMNTLAYIVGLSQPACSRAVDKLVKARLIGREQGRGNEVNLTLTPAGRRCAEQFQSRRIAALSTLLKTLSAGERVAFGRMVDKLLKAPVTGREYARRVCRFCDHEICGGGPDCAVDRAASALESHGH